MSFSASENLDEAIRRLGLPKLGCQYTCPITTHEHTFGSPPPEDSHQIKISRQTGLNFQWWCEGFPPENQFILEFLLFNKIIQKISRDATLFWRALVDGIRSPHHIVNRSYEIMKANNAFAKLTNIEVKNLKGKICYQVLANRNHPCPQCPIERSQAELINFPSGKKLVHASHIEGDFFSIYYRDLQEELELIQKFTHDYKLNLLGKTFDDFNHNLNFALDELHRIIKKIKSDEDRATLLRAWERCHKISTNLTKFLSPPTETDLHSKTLIKTVVENVVLFLRPQLRNIDVKTFGSDQEILPGEISDWEQVFFNIMTNACAAMSNGGTLSIRWDKNNILEIEDTGHGIHPDELPHIFQPLFSRKLAQGGTGLGLWVVWQLLQRLGFDIKATSTLGVGTTFSISKII